MSAYLDMESAQFENLNSMRKYPFADESSLVDTCGIELPTDVIVDAHVTVPAFVSDSSSDSSSDSPGGHYGEPSAHATPLARLSSVHLSKSMVSACFSFMSGVRLYAASVTVSASSFRPYFPYPLNPLSGHEGASGFVSFGNIDLPGTPKTFFLENAILHPCCVAVTPPAALRRFIDPRSGESVSGKVKIDFSMHVDAARQGNGFMLSLGDGSEEELASGCVRSIGSSPCGATPIKSINGVRPDEDGNIVLWFH